MSDFEKVDILVSKYGLTVSRAREIVEHKDSELIVLLMQLAYAKGQKNIYESYSYNGGL
jgi:hypothetical protein